MTIIVELPRKKESQLDQAIGAGKRFAASKHSSMSKYFDAGEKKGDRRKTAAIRHYAGKRLLGLQYYPKPWIFESQSGEKVAMPAGYFARVNGILENIIAI